MTRTLCALLLCAAPATTTAGPLDERLLGTNPCRDLPQISETEAVTLESARIDLLPDTAEMSVAGTISCRSGEGALMTADASVRIEAKVWLELAGCTSTRTRVNLSDFGGSLGPIVEALAPQLEQDLAADVASAAERTCRDLLD